MFRLKNKWSETILLQCGKLLVHELFKYLQEIYISLQPVTANVSVFTSSVVNNWSKLSGMIHLNEDTLA